MITHKPPIKDDMLRTIVQVARLYYERDMSQQAIADKLGVSRSLIAKYLLQSKARGIVRIEIVDPGENSGELSGAIKSRFGLAHVEVIANAHASEALTLQGVARAAASYFARNLKAREKVGIAWGRSVKSVVDQLPIQKITAADVDVIPLLGESSNARLYSRMNELVEQMAGAIDGRAQFLFYPMTVDSKSLYNKIVKEPVLVGITKTWDDLDWAFVGIGATPPTEGMAVYVAEEYVPALRRSSAVGDICCRYYNENGRFVKTPFGDQIIGIDVNQLKKAAHVVAVAVGKDKARAVRGALSTGLITTLFVDQALAQAVLADGDDHANT